jgi:uncharacterized protein YidB (DUF937 family)
MKRESRKGKALEIVMRPSERDALHALAERLGMSTNELVCRLVRRAVESPERFDLSPGGRP